MHHPTDRIIHTTDVAIPVVEHWLEREIAQWIHHEGSIRRPIAPLAKATSLIYLTMNINRYKCSGPFTYEHGGGSFMCSTRTAAATAGQGDPWTQW